MGLPFTGNWLGIKKKMVNNLVIFRVKCLQVKMTTGATIHTTNGLMMSVRRRTSFHPTETKIPVVDTASPANITETAMPNGSKEGIF